jgi:predicted component of type VI protein secretion system
MADADREGWWVEWHSGGEPRRVVLNGRLRLGRSAQADIVIEDPYVSREHCTLEVQDGGVLVDASRSVNRIRVNGREMECVHFAQAASFVVGGTSVEVRPIAVSDETTLYMTRPAPTLTFRRSTRELLAPEGTVIVQLSTHEAAALDAIASKFPDAADHDTIAAATWGEPDYPRYLIHRLMQRLRERLGDHADLVENVRGAGYRIRSPLDLL